jgi:hypothetical protein
MGAFLRRTKLSSAYIAKQAAEWTGVVFAVAGYIGLFVSFEGLFKEIDSFWYKLFISTVILTGTWVACAMIVGIRAGCQIKKKVVEGKNGKAVYVIYGDIFDPKIIDSQKRYIAFAVNRCFDTIVDDNLVGANTVHGMAFNRLYNQGKYTSVTLNTALQAAIKGTPTYKMLTIAQKPSGNLKRYEVGTYANLQIDDRLNYLLVGLSYFDTNLNAHVSKQEYVLCTQKMIEYFDMEAQGYPVLMPIIGAGRSRTDLQEREALEYLISAFKVNQNKITSDIYIVVYESAKNRVAIADL